MEELLSMIPFYKFVVSLVILIAAIITGRIVSLILNSLFVFVFRSKQLKKYKIVTSILENADNIKKIVEIIFILLGLLLIASTFDFKFADDVIAQLILFLPKVFAALIMIYLGFIFASIIYDIIIKFAKSKIIRYERHGILKQIVILVAQLIRYLIILVTIITAISILGIPTSTINVILYSTITILIAPTLAGLISIGWFIGPKIAAGSYLNEVIRFKRGDVILIKNLEGEVEGMSALHVKLISKGKEIYVPVNDFLNGAFERKKE